ncbi:MAG: 3-isopropylmalate dehydratase small subunit [Burkholderiaceae bacterium]|nr:3-isopropylmalate dehydratase small subunit [Burkholderiaceae bacterium]
MTDATRIKGVAAPLPLANLDTDQIMPKQFLRGIDKMGLAQGLLYDLRFDGEGQARPEFVLNRPAFAATRMLIAGANFGCGSSREHAVWGLQQHGIQAVIAPSFGEIFYSNAMNNRLLLVMLEPDQVQALIDEAQASAEPMQVSIDLQTMTLQSPALQASFSLAERHRRMFLEGLDMIGASLSHRDQIKAFAARHWAAQPWLRDVARITTERLG